MENHDSPMAYLGEVTVTSLEGALHFDATVEQDSSGQRVGILQAAIIDRASLREHGYTLAGALDEDNDLVHFLPLVQGARDRWCQAVTEMACRRSVLVLKHLWIDENQRGRRYGLHAISEFCRTIAKPAGAGVALMYPTPTSPDGWEPLADMTPALRERGARALRRYYALLGFKSVRPARLMACAIDDVRSAPRTTGAAAGPEPPALSHPLRRHAQTMDPRRGLIASSTTASAEACAPGEVAPSLGAGRGPPEKAGTTSRVGSISQRGATA